MIEIVYPGNASSSTPETLSAVSSPLSPTLVPPTSIPARYYYKIENALQFESALILFTRYTSRTERVVMKILREYKDSRYSLEALGERQQCQLEALRRNRVFTPEVYIGLAPICNVDLDQESIYIGEIISNPTKEMLDPNAEYALLMHQLPEGRRLDSLLEEEEEASLWSYLQLLTKHVAHIHTDLDPTAPNENGVQWGSYEQLRKKLLHNFGLLDLVLTTSENGRHSTDDWSKESLDRLKDTLFRVFTQSRYRSRFEQRVCEQRIKRCHGDLKTPHIWIVPSHYSCDGESDRCIKILDAIDFNSMYSNIDTLSDFAMLVVDVQARAKSFRLVNGMVEDYLKLTEQQDEISRSVLGYYLVEKAIVGAAISIVYDNLPELGLRLLEVAEMRLQCLVARQALDHASV